MVVSELTKTGFCYCWFPGVSPQIDCSVGWFGISLGKNKVFSRSERNTKLWRSRSHPEAQVKKWCLSNMCWWLADSMPPLTFPAYTQQNQDNHTLTYMHIYVYLGYYFFTKNQTLVLPPRYPDLSSWSRPDDANRSISLAKYAHFMFGFLTAHLELASMQNNCAQYSDGLNV